MCLKCDRASITGLLRLPLAFNGPSGPFFEEEGAPLASLLADSALVTPEAAEQYLAGEAAKVRAAVIAMFQDEDWAPPLGAGPTPFHCQKHIPSLW